MISFLLFLLLLLAGCGSGSATGSATPTPQGPQDKAQIALPYALKEGGWVSLAMAKDGTLWVMEAASKSGLTTEIIRVTPDGKQKVFTPAAPMQLTSQNIVVGPDGNLWFGEKNPSNYGVYVGRMTPDGVFTDFKLPDGVIQVNDLITGSDGNIWLSQSAFITQPGTFISQNTGVAGRMTPDGKLTEWNTAAGVQITTLAPGPNGSIWFGENNSSSGQGKIAHFTPGDQLAEYPLEVAPSASGMVLGPDQNYWFNEAKLIYNDPKPAKIGRITSAGTITHFTLPAGVNPNGSLVSGTNGQIWLPAIGPKGGLAMQMTLTGTVKQYPLSAKAARPFALVPAADKSFWGLAWTPEKSLVLFHLG